MRRLIATPSLSNPISGIKILLIIVYYFAIYPVWAQCTAPNISLPDENQPVISPSVSYCVNIPINPAISGHPIGFSLELEHTFVGDLSIRVNNCGDTLMLLTRPGGGSCNAGAPYGSSASVNGYFTFSEGGGPNPDNGLSFGGGNYGLSLDPCNVNTVNSFADLVAACGSGPYTLELCITDHASVDVGNAGVIAPVFPGIPPVFCGCTDVFATNYNPSATFDDGSCTYSVFCGETFYDSGGPLNGYQNEENYTTIICPDTPEELIETSFSVFNLQGSDDELIVFDGPNTNSPVLGTYTEGASPGVVVSSDLSGCLTFQFISGPDGTEDGWEAEVNCRERCPDENTTFFQTTSICEGGSYEFNGQILSAPGEYTATFQNSLGCDSTVNLNLIIYPEVPQGFDMSGITLSSCQDAEGEGLFNLEILLEEGIQNYSAVFYTTQDSAALITNPGSYRSGPGVVYLRFFSSEECTSDFIPVQLTLEDGLFPPVNCTGTVCEGEIGVYTTTAPSDCQPYIWEVNGFGEILNGGSPADSFIVVQWHTAGEGTLSLSLGGCPNAGYCPVAYRQIIPVMGSSNEVIGPEVVCNGAIASYKIPPFEGTEINWTVSPGGQILAGQGTPQILVKWNAAGYGNQQVVGVEYDNCILSCGGMSSLEINVLQDLAITGRPDLCSGDTLDLTLYEVGAGIPVEGQWVLQSVSGEVVAEWPSPVSNLIAALDFPAGSYELLGIASEGATFCVDTVRKEIEIYAIPPSPLDIEGDLRVCTGGHSVMTALPAADSVDTRWEIFDGTGTIRYGNQINHLWGAEMPFSMEVRHVSLDGGRCYSPPLVVNLDEVPLATVSGTEIHCTGDTSIYFVDEGHHNGEWNITPANAAVVLKSSQDSITIEWIKPGNAEVVYGLCNRADTLDVLVSEVTHIGLIPIDTWCPEEPIVVEFSQPHTSYQWFNSVDSLISTAPTPELDTGLYWLSVRNEYGCSKDTFVGVFRYPGVEVPLWNGASDFCLLGTDTLFTITGGGIVGYRWIRNDQTVGQNQPSLVINEEGTYSVEIETIDGCLFMSDTKSFQCMPGYNCNAQELDFRIDSLSECLNYIAYTDFDEEPVSFTWSVSNLISGLGGFNSTQDTISLNIEEGTVLGIQLSAVFYDPLFPDSSRLHCKTKHINHPVKAGFEAAQDCAEKPIRFQNTSRLIPGNEQTDVSWTWNFNDPQDPAVSASFSPHHTYFQPDTFRVQLTAELGGCSSTIYREVIVNPRAYSVFELPAQACPGNSVVLSADTVLNAGHNTAYSWEQISIEPNTLEGPSASTFLEPLDSAIIALYTLNQFGCMDTLERSITAPDIISGAIDTFPDLPACEADSILLSAPAGGESWVWSNGQTTESISTTIREEYMVEVTDPHQCVYSFGPVNTDFDELPFFPVRAILYDENGDIEGYVYDTLVICEGEDVYLETITEPPFNIQWNNGNTNTQIEFSEDRANQLESGVHEIFVTVGSPFSSCLDTIPIQIIVSAPPPSAELVSDTPGPLCEGTPYTISISNPTPGITYVWPNDSTGISLTTSEADAYTVTSIDSLGCSSISDTLQIYAAPNTAQVASGCLTRCRPDTLCFPDLSGMSAFSWYFNGVPFSTDSLLVATESGTYQFYAENSFGCTSISEPLDLTLFDGVGTITAEVLLDINENGIIDAADSLLSGVVIDWASPEWGSGADTTNEAGLIVLPFQPAGNYELILDETSLGFPLDSALPAYDTTIVGCDNIYSFIWLLDPPACINTVNNLSVNQCAEEPFYFNGAEYESDTIITVTFQSVAGCDSTVIASVSFQSYPVRFLDTVLCQGELLDWAGQTYSESGTYTDTLMLANTCDTIWEVTLSYMQPDTVPKELVSCDGEPVLFDGQWIAPGETVMVYPDEFACDTVFEVTVEGAIIPEFSIQTSPTCTGSQTGELSVSITNILNPQFSIDGISFQSSPEFNELPAGANTIYVQDSDGCISSDIFIIDTIPVLSAWADTFTLNCPGDELTIFPSYQISDSSWVDVLWEGGQNTSVVSVDSEGIFPLTISNGCETYSLSIEVEESAAFEPAKIMILDTLEGCLDTLVLSGNLPNGATGIWGTSSPVTIQNPSLGGALITWDNVGESMVTWTLSTEACPGFAVDTLLVEMYDQDVFDTLQTISCEGDPIEYNGAVFNSDTTFTELYTSITGCDSTVQIQFSFLPLLTQSIDTVLCAGETFEWAGNSYSSSGVFSDTIAVPGSCDTVWNISLMYLQTDTIFQELISCNGESIQFEGIWIEPGDTVFLSPNSLECDTVYEVTVNTATVPEILVTAQPTCTGQQTGEITVSANGIDAPQYSIDSINFQSTPGFNELPAGFNSVYVRGSEGCVFQEPFFIDTIPVLTAWADTFSINCPGDLIAIHPSYQITDSSWVDIIWEDGQGTPELEVEDSGTYPVIVTNGCEYFDMGIIVQSGAVLEPAEITGPGTLLGCLDTLTLQGNLPNGSFGLWETDPASIITSPTSPATSIIWEGLGAGWAVWSLSTADCPSYSQDTLWLIPPPAFAAVNDQLQIPADSLQGSIDILANDQLPNGPYTTALTDSTYASHLSLSNGQLTVTGPDALPPTFEVPYKLCLLDCPEVCADAIVRISIGQASDETTIWNGITPNGDGLNETLVFDQLEEAPDEYPNNELIIFNRWGDIVFRAQPYQNDWGGTNQKGGRLPDGTYYYILRLDIGGGEIIKGDVTILR